MSSSTSLLFPPRLVLWIGTLHLTARGPFHLPLWRDSGAFASWWGTNLESLVVLLGWTSWCWPSYSWRCFWRLGCGPFVFWDPPPPSVCMMPPVDIHCIMRNKVLHLHLNAWLPPEVTLSRHPWLHSIVIYMASAGDLRCCPPCRARRCVDARRDRARYIILPFFRGVTKFPTIWLYQNYTNLGMISTYDSIMLFILAII